MKNCNIIFTRRQQWRRLLRHRINSKKINKDHILHSPLNFISTDEYNEKTIFGYCRHIKKVTFSSEVEIHYFNNLT